MSNYTKSTNFAAKDALASGNAAKIVKGTEIDTEFNNIATAVATKADSANPTFTGTVTLPSTVISLADGTTAVTQTTTDSSTLVATTAFVKAALASMYPVGSIYTNVAVSTNPATLFGFGTWTAFGAGRVMVGLDAGNALFDTVGETGGSADATLVSHTHSVTDPGHAHSYNRDALDMLDGGVFTRRSGTGADPNTTSTVTTGITIGSAGSSATNANYPPYITVYMWRRTA
jgi:hypothetical protein